MTELPPDRYLYEYCVLRYVPHIERGECVNVGLIMMCKRQCWLKGEVHLDAARLRAIDPTVDIPALSRQLSLFAMTDQPSADIAVEDRYRWLASTKSAVIQTSPSHPAFVAPRLRWSEKPLDDTFAELFAALVLPPVSSAEKK